jgi:hypothetical protein
MINIGIRKGTEEGVRWGLHDVETDNRGLDETWVHLYNEDRTDYLTVVIGIKDAIDIVENAFENHYPEDSDILLRAREMCEDLRDFLKGENVYA